MDMITFSEAVTVRISSVPCEGLASIACPGCREGLDLAQPDPHSSERLLGICGECSTWYLIDLSADLGMARLVSLASIANLTTGARLRPQRAGG